MDDKPHVPFRPLELPPTLALIEQLQADRRYRDTRQLFFVEGVRNFVAAVDYDYPVDTLLYSERLLTSPVARMFVRKLKRAGVPFAQASPEQFRRVSRAEHVSGVGVVLRQRVQHLHRINPSGHLCWVALNAVRSPGNFGTLIRTSAAIGAAGFILLEKQVDPFDPTVVRATMGTLFKQAMVRATPEEFRRWVQLHRIPVIGASPDGSIDYDHVGYWHPCVIMLGEERSGLSDAQRSICQQIVRIPMVESVDSLNLAVAGSLLLYEVFRSGRQDSAGAWPPHLGSDPPATRQ
jgi:RNA methyltransferase, TrmH family